MTTNPQRIPFAGSVGKTVARVFSCVDTCLLIVWTDGTYSYVTAELSHGCAELTEEDANKHDLLRSGLVTEEWYEARQEEERRQREEREKQRDLAELERLKRKWGDG